MSWMWVIIVICIAFNISVLILHTQPKQVFKKVKLGIATTTIAIDRTIESGKQTNVGKIISFTDQIIISSNVKVFFPYNVLLHFVICLLCALVFFSWISKYTNLGIALIFSMLGLVIPYVVLQLITENMTNRTREHAREYFIIVKNYLMATGNIFTAFEKSYKYAIQPLRTYIEILVYEYNNKVGAANAIDNFIKKIRDNELKLFMENLKIAYISGSDITLLLEEFINQLDKLNEDSRYENFYDRVLNLGLYVLLSFNFGIIYFIVIKKDYINTFTGQAIFTADILISAYIIYLTLKKQV